jgi:RNA polymerase sigma-70 factor (ECF subfamily)
MHRLPVEDEPRAAAEARQSADDDRRLALALRDGRPEAFEPFAERFGPLILNFGRRMCGHRDDAEEVMQETLLKAFLSLKDLRDPAALRTWVYRVAANACMKMRRRGRHEPKERPLSLDELAPRPSADGAPPQIADWSNLPLDRLLRGELSAKLEQAILGLPKEFRVILVLRDQEGLSTREAADIVGISTTLVKVRLHRARLALRRSLDGYLAWKPGGAARGRRAGR